MTNLARMMRAKANPAMKATSTATTKLSEIPPSSHSYLRPHHQVLDLNNLHMLSRQHNAFANQSLRPLIQDRMFLKNTKLPNTRPSNAKPKPKLRPKHNLKCHTLSKLPRPCGVSLAKSRRRPTTKLSTIPCTERNGQPQSKRN